MNSTTQLNPNSEGAGLAPCKSGCPANIDVPEYIRFISQGQYDLARAAIAEKVPFPKSLGYICFRPCESVCRRGEIDKPVAVCHLKRFAADNGNPQAMLRERMAFKKIAKDNATGKSIAIIGAGPAGLTAAYFLGLKGHSVTIFDKEAEPGGMMRYAIPEYRLPKTVLEEDLTYMWRLDVKFKGNQKVNVKDLILRYDALLIASGNPIPRKLRIGGVELSGILWGLDFLRSIRQGEKMDVKGKVMVVGGGHVAVNVALSAKRLGASEVSMVCLEKRDEMPAYNWEIDQALEEGIQVHTSWAPKALKGENGSDVSATGGYTLTGKKIVRGASGKVTGVEFMRCVSVFNENAQFSPEYDDCEIKYFDADTVIFAIGQAPDSSFIDVEGITTERGFVTVDNDLMTTKKGVFACGEAIQPLGSVIDTVKQGRMAAESLDKYLGGNGNIDIQLYDRKSSAQKIERDEEIVKEQRVPMRRLQPEQRIDFSLIELGYDKDEAAKEASRCLQCDLRFSK